MSRTALAALAVATAVLTAACSTSEPVASSVAAGHAAGHPAPHGAPPHEAPTATAPTGVTGSVWVANEGSDSLSVLDAASGGTHVTLTGVPSPHNVQAAADGARVWAVTGSDQVVTVATDRMRLAQVAPTDSSPAHVVEAPDGHVVVTASGQASVYVYDAALRPLRRIGLSGRPHGVRLAADGRTAIVANTADGTLDVVDTRDGTVRTRVPVGPGPVQTAVSPDGRVAYASVGGARQVVRVDLVRGTVTARQPVPAAPAQVFLTSTGKLLVANQGTESAPGSTLSVLEATTLEVLGEVGVGSGPHGVVSDPHGRFAWVSNMFEGTVTAVDLSRLSAIGAVPVGSSPNGITFSPRRVDTGPGGTLVMHVPPREDRSGHGSSHGHG